MSGVDIAGLVERLRAAINLGDRTGSRGKRPENIYNVADDAADALLAQAAELAEANRRERKSIDDLCRWRAAFQSVTPGGSEFMDPAAVRGWANMLKEQVFEANKKAVLSERRVVEALAALKASEEREATKDAVLRKFLDFADADYVPNALFARARSVLENSKTRLADATNNPPSDPGTEQREAGRG